MRWNKEVSVSVIIPMKDSQVNLYRSIRQARNAILCEKEIVLTVPRSRIKEMGKARLLSLCFPGLKIAVSGDETVEGLILAGLKSAGGKWLLPVLPGARFYREGFLEIEPMLEESSSDVIFHDVDNLHREHRCLYDALIRRRFLEGIPFCEPADSDWRGRRLMDRIIGEDTGLGYTRACLHSSCMTWNELVQRSLSIHLTDHCNLNCEYCSQYSSVAPEYYLDPDGLERDLKTLPPIERIMFTGGEPLLHPDIAGILRLTRRYQPDSKIAVITNGLNLHCMSDDFYRAVEECGITIYHSVYPSGRGENPEEKEKNEGWARIREHVRRWKVTDFVRSPLSETGGDAARNYVLCGVHCPQLRDGVIYPCTVTAYSFILNERFGTSFVLGEGDSLPLDQIRSEEELWDWALGPRSFCRYCRPEKNSRHPWRQGGGQASEWIDNEGEITRPLKTAGFPYIMIS